MTATEMVLKALQCDVYGEPYTVAVAVQDKDGNILARLVDGRLVTITVIEVIPPEEGECQK